eukprot:CAMPEP_0171634380 /NCGR_PEP_ID=MMETSP0990-20121206/25889_1 /TAXON_ID=483369 /ORGANISM="non described non described, Strain CCMP2098" /LENGTH=117 /DNA_ID=CAMNT_0012205527 /DNA_START=496 /DNA_END=849 /DNA_ORIENTATION=-
MGADGFLCPANSRPVGHQVALPPVKAHQRRRRFRALLGAISGRSAAKEQAEAEAALVHGVFEVAEGGAAGRLGVQVGEEDAHKRAALRGQVEPRHAVGRHREGVDDSAGHAPHDQAA